MIIMMIMMMVCEQPDRSPTSGTSVGPAVFDDELMEITTGGTVLEHSLPDHDRNQLGESEQLLDRC